MTNGRGLSNGLMTRRRITTTSVIGVVRIPSVMLEGARGRLL